MTIKNPSRRDFLFASMGVIAAKFVYSQELQSSQAITAGQIIERIKSNIGASWTGQTLDNIIIGNSETSVKGIATAIIATLDVIQRAAASGKNMVITHEPAFYSQQNNITQYQQDSTYLFKKDFLEKNNIVVFRLYDHWLARKPNGNVEGTMRELGWEKNVDPQNSNMFKFDGIPLLQLAKEIETKLNIRTLRVLGDPKMPVKRAAIGFGNTTLNQGVELLSRDDVDVIIIGEANEWDVNEYAIDAFSSGKNKAVIYLGHLKSDMPGMKFCAEWLRGFIKEVPVEYIDMSEPFWFADKPEWHY